MPSIRFSFLVASDRCDELVAELWALGTSGMELIDGAENNRVDAYFTFASAPTTPMGETLVERCGGRLIDVREIEDQDWQANYRALSEPIVVGPFTFDPREPEEGFAPAGDALRVPARNAFGTGSHESTRLILEGLAAADLAGRAVLDVGTGSGILALAALRRGARWAAGFDFDVGSVVSARDNGRLNGLAPALLAGTIDALGGSFDVVLVNILPHRWLHQAPAVIDRLAVGGLLLVSGLLATEEDAVGRRLEALGLEVACRRREGEWAALDLRRMG